MPGFILNAWHVGTLLSIAGIEPPSAGSPLSALPVYPRPIAPGEPDWGYLVDKKLVVQNGAGWRVNAVMAGVLRACAHPDDVVHVGVGDSENPGFAVVRRGALVSECTIARSGTTKLYFPLTRSAVMLSLLCALSGSDADDAAAGAPKPSGFRFRGKAEDAFVLGAALRELRSGTPQPMPVPALKAAVQRYAQDRQLTVGFAVFGLAEVMDSLASSTRKSDAAIKRLVTAGHLKMVREKVKVSPAAEAALTKWPTAIFSINHVELRPEGAVSRLMQVMRVGGRTLLFRPIQHAGHVPEFEWAEVSRRELRALVAATLLRDEELAAFVAGKRLPAAAAAARAAKAKKAARPAKVARKAAKATAKVTAEAAPTPARSARGAARTAAATAAPVWTATHVVPPSGLPAWTTPDGTQPAAATLDASLPVQVVDVANGWARIVCSNGWEAWVNASLLTPA
jgi:hypothetical protein